MSAPEILSREPFDAAAFEALTRAFAAGELRPGQGRLQAAPRPISDAEADAPLRLTELQSAKIAQLALLGESAIHAGRVALLIMAGGMATRFGGGAKGVVPLIEGESRSFLAYALESAVRISRGSRDGQGSIPVVVMTSFATHAAVVEQLESIDWAGLPAEDRYLMRQSILPRVLADGRTAYSDPARADWPETSTFAAPGHGDTLGRLRESGCLAQLRARGVSHLLVANVDNLGSGVDPVLVGAHLEAVAGGAEMSVEVVRREANDAGGCVARLDDGRPAIVEAFRLPEGTTLADYPHFNTNTLWFSLAALERELPLTWFAVEKTIQSPTGEDQKVTQFERLIGQATEFLRSAFVEVPREIRFAPVKTREDLAALADEIRARIAEPDAYSLVAVTRHKA